MRLLALAALLLAAACKTPPPSRSPSGMSTDQFEDIPAPKTANYIYGDNQSFSYRSQTFRCGRFLYEYQGSHADAVRFFKETMVSVPYSWTLAGEDGSGSGSTTLTFEKNDDRCTVDVDYIPRPDIARQNNVNILVRVNYLR